MCLPPGTGHGSKPPSWCLAAQWNLSLIAAFHWHWAKFQRHHEKSHQKAGKRRPSVDFKAKWGPMVVFDNQGKTVSLALPTKKQE